jgi:hypothetical protein
MAPTTCIWWTELSLWPRDWEAEEDAQQGDHRLVWRMQGPTPARAPNDQLCLEQEGQITQNQLQKGQRAYQLQCDQGWRRQRHAHLRLCAHVPVSTTLQMDTTPVFRSRKVVGAQHLRVVEWALAVCSRGQGHHSISLRPILHNTNRLVASRQRQLTQCCQGQDCR